jgi:hypothetical protein
VHFNYSYQKYYGHLKIYFPRKNPSQISGYMHFPNAPLEYKKVSLKGVAQHDKRKRKLEDISTSKGSIHSKGNYNMDGGFEYL